MTTRAGLLALIRTRMASTAIWPDASVNIWINDAIRDYSIYFPRLLTATIASVTGQFEYSLSALVNPQAILAVEAPDGATPMNFLVYRPSDGVKDFWGGEYYDVWGIKAPATLVLGTAIATGSNIIVSYSADHAYVSADADVLTVPERHLDGLALFVWVKGTQQVLAAQAADPQVNTLLLSQFDMLVYRASREYRYWLRYVQSERDQMRWREHRERVRWEGLRKGT